MSNKHQTQIVRDLPNKKLHVTRIFDAQPEKVWKAWTDAEILDQWWAPKPWKAETKTMEFKDGGHWLYAMVGPENETHWSRADFSHIQPQKSFQALSSFCDEQGKVSDGMPGSRWKNEFHTDGTGTKVTVEISFDNEADLNKLVEMGFESGFTMGLNNLDEYLAKA